MKYSQWWAGMDSNHRSRKATDLQSVPFNHSGTYPDQFIKWDTIGGPIWTRTKDRPVMSRLL